MGKTVGRLLFSIRLLLTGHFPPFQVHGIDQWVVIEASTNQMAIQLPVCCVCGHIQVNLYLPRGIIGTSEAIFALFGSYSSVSLHSKGANDVLWYCRCIVKVLEGFVMYKQIYAMIFGVGCTQTGASFGRAPTAVYCISQHMKVHLDPFKA